MYRFLLLAIFLGIIIGSALATCTNYFRYENDGQQTYGIVEVPPPTFGTPLKLELYMFLEAQLPDVSLI